MSETTVVQNIIDAVSAGPRHLGSLIWWTLEDARTYGATLRDIWIRHGLREETLPALPPPARALRDAGAKAVAGKNSPYLFRPAGRQDGRVYYSLVEESLLSPGNLSQRVVARFDIERDGKFLGKQVEPPDRTVSLVADEIEREYRETVWYYQPRDIRTAILNVLAESRAVSLREHGGIYWIPDGFDQVAAALSKAVSLLGRSHMSVIPISSSQQGIDAITRAVSVTLDEELGALTRDLQEFSLSRAHGEHLQDRTIQSAIGQINDLKERTRIYRDILEFKSADLEVRLNEALLSAASLMTDGGEP
jgi:hypothetical protein